MPTPLVTVGITCFDAADTVARAVESACAQEWHELEVVVVDDASRDDTVAVATTLFGDFVLPFEIVSVLLLAAVIGGVFLAKREHGGID